MLEFAAEVVTAASPDELAGIVTDGLPRLIDCGTASSSELDSSGRPRTRTDTLTVAMAPRHGSRELNEHDGAVVDMLRPFLAAALANVRAREELTARRTLAEATDTDFLMIGGDGSFRGGSPRTIERLRRFFPGWRGEHRRPPEPIAALALRDGAAPPLIVVRPEARVVLRQLGHVDGATLLAVQEQRTRLSRAALARLGLSQRETDIVGLVVRGHTNRQIARSLALSPHTVRTHLERILDKLGARSRAEATAVALEAALLPGWVDLDKDGPAIGSV